MSIVTVTTYDPMVRVLKPTAAIKDEVKLRGQLNKILSDAVNGPSQQAGQNGIPTKRNTPGGSQQAGGSGRVESVVNNNNNNVTVIEAHNPAYTAAAVVNQLKWEQRQGGDAGGRLARTS